MKQFIQNIGPFVILRNIKYHIGKPTDNEL